MNDLVKCVEISMNRKIPSMRLPYWFGYLGGKSFDFLSLITGKKFPISAVRIKKFCATTQFRADLLERSDFVAPFTIIDGLKRTLFYEFIDPNKDETTYISE